MTRRFGPSALMLGNFVIGTSVLAPTGMLHQLSSGLAVSIREPSLLVTFGAVGMTVWGLGFASTNSMQQARLVGAAPALAGAAVSLNTSSLYIGQALGSALGGALFEGGRQLLMSYGAVTFILAGAAVLTLTRPKPGRPTLAPSVSSSPGRPF